MPTPLRHVVAPLVAALYLSSCGFGEEDEVVDDPMSPRPATEPGPARTRHTEPACTDTGVCAGCVAYGERRTRVRVWVTDRNGKTLDEWFTCPDPERRRGR